jgi:8-oxo-dGTP diphosphatase
LGWGRGDQNGLGAAVGLRPSQFPAFGVTVDLVILTLADRAPGGLLVRRGQPLRGHLGAARRLQAADRDQRRGGYELPTETSDEAAARELAEETGVDAACLLAQFGAYGSRPATPHGRGGRGWVDIPTEQAGSSRSGGG